MAEGTCAVPGCADPVYCKRYCIRHYRKLRRHGDPLQGREIGRTPRLPRGAPLVDRFWVKVSKRGPDDCWEWQGGLSGSGHGVFRGAEVTRTFGTQQAHRIAWLLDGRAFVQGLVLDHLCRTRRCVNVRHLEQVTPVLNTMRGQGVGPMNLAKTHCRQGHLYSPDNTYRPPDGPRVCRTCATEKARRYRARKRTGND